MSGTLSRASPSSEENSFSKPTSRSHPSKPQRILACVLCQQRKVKCDRKFPCANCVKAGTQCMPATLMPRQRRHKRRFPEKVLLDRLRKYEDLLRENHINFEHLQKDIGESGGTGPENNPESDDEKSDVKISDAMSPTANIKSEVNYEAKNIWHAMSRGFREANYDSDSSHDDMRGYLVREALNKEFEEDDHLLFGSRSTGIDLSTLHPEPAQIFKLWQIYLDNVDPLLKVTHKPSLQGRIIEAAGDVSKIEANLEALMFGIYCMAILSLDDDECQKGFGASQDVLLRNYHFACQQALSNSRFLHSNNRDCLTALYFYLVSIRSTVFPRSLSSMIGVALRIAQHMGIHSESSLSKCTILEAELRRRLWWSIVMFDNRIGEMAEFKATSLSPTWDCRLPLNVNDSDLRAEMSEPPIVQGLSTEALFVIVRCEVGQVVRHSRVHLEFTNPALKPLVDDTVPEGDEVANLEAMIESRFLKFCDPENPLHFMTLWTTRAFITKYRLFEHHSKHFSTGSLQTDAERDQAVRFALKLLEYDTKLVASSIVKGFRWLTFFHFPFPAYLQIVQDLRRRPLSDHADDAWRIMSDNQDARSLMIFKKDSPLFKMFSKVVVQTWEARVEAVKASGIPRTPPVVGAAMEFLFATAMRDQETAQPSQPLGLPTDDFPMSAPVDFEFDRMVYGISGFQGFANLGSGMRMYPNMMHSGSFDTGMDQLDMATMDWSLADQTSGPMRPPPPVWPPY